MADAQNPFNFDPRIAVAKVPPEPDSAREPYPEKLIRGSIDRLGSMLGWGRSEGNPFENVIPKGARVVVKPNMVLHKNEGPGGILPLVTHQSVIQAVVEGALKTGTAEVTVADAPIQGCDFGALLQATGLDVWSAEIQKRDSRFKGIRDLRRTVCLLKHGVRLAEEDVQPLENFILFDLESESLLEHITSGENPFRVTWYDPRLMDQTHRRGKHQYLVAREIIDADIVINLPKLKTHKKAGITCALKNLIGINGNKEYLPHHRVGGSETGGDCYPGKSSVKRSLEYVADQQNMTSSPIAGQFWHALTFGLVRVSRLSGDRLGYEGSWSGNDTIWRTCLDLNRILLYGRRDGTLGDQPQRRTLHIVDAVIAGQGEGPLAPQALPMNLLLAAQNAAALDWVAAQLLGYDPTRIPISREALKQFRWPIANFSRREINLVGDFDEGVADDVLQLGLRANSVIYPFGWRDAAARQPSISENGNYASPELSHEG
ncbi:MAG: DUF362 domain-containing protein [Pyrinomonadaceae bacterium]|nr:DUF362 domain-containing protein [Pyrinomonadaceae bacterium]